MLVMLLNSGAGAGRSLVLLGPEFEVVGLLRLRLVVGRGAPELLVAVGL